MGQFVKTEPTDLKTEYMEEFFKTEPGYVKAEYEEKMYQKYCKGESQ